MGTTIGSSAFNTESSAKLFGVYLRDQLLTETASEAALRALSTILASDAQWASYVIGTLVDTFCATLLQDNTENNERRHAASFHRILPSWKKPTTWSSNRRDHIQTHSTGLINMTKMVNDGSFNGITIGVPSRMIAAEIISPALLRGNPRLSLPLNSPFKCIGAMLILKARLLSGCIASEELCIILDELLCFVHHIVEEGGERGDYPHRPEGLGGPTTSHLFSMREVFPSLRGQTQGEGGAPSEVVSTLAHFVAENLHIILTKSSSVSLSPFLLPTILLMMRIADWEGVLYLNETTSQFNKKTAKMGDIISELSSGDARILSEIPREGVQDGIFRSGHPIAVAEMEGEGEGEEEEEEEMGDDEVENPAVLANADLSELREEAMCQLSRASASKVVCDAVALLIQQVDTLSSTETLHFSEKACLLVSPELLDNVQEVASLFFGGVVARCLSDDFLWVSHSMMTACTTLLAFVSKLLRGVDFATCISHSIPETVLRQNSTICEGIGRSLLNADLLTPIACLSGKIAKSVGVDATVLYQICNMIEVFVPTAAFCANKYNVAESSEEIIENNGMQYTTVTSKEATSDLCLIALGRLTARTQCDKIPSAIRLLCDHRGVCVDLDLFVSHRGTLSPLCVHIICLAQNLLERVEGGGDVKALCGVLKCFKVVLCQSGGADVGSFVEKMLSFAGAAGGQRYQIILACVQLSSGVASLCSHDAAKSALDAYSLYLSNAMTTTTTISPEETQETAKLLRTELHELNSNHLLIFFRVFLTAMDTLPAFKDLQFGQKNALARFRLDILTALLTLCSPRYEEAIFCTVTSNEVKRLVNKILPFLRTTPDSGIEERSCATALRLTLRILSIAQSRHFTGVAHAVTASIVPFISSLLSRFFHHPASGVLTTFSDSITSFFGLISSTSSPIIFDALFGVNICLLAVGCFLHSVSLIEVGLSARSGTSVEGMKGGLSMSEQALWRDFTKSTLQDRRAVRSEIFTTKNIASFELLGSFLGTYLSTTNTSSNSAGFGFEKSSIIDQMLESIHTTAGSISTKEPPAEEPLHQAILFLHGFTSIFEGQRIDAVLLVISEIKLTGLYENLRVLDAFDNQTHPLPEGLYCLLRGAAYRCVQSLRRCEVANTTSSSSPSVPLRSGYTGKPSLQPTPPPLPTLIQKLGNKGDHTAAVDLLAKRISEKGDRVSLSCAYHAVQYGTDYSSICPALYTLIKKGGEEEEGVSNVLCEATLKHPVSLFEIILRGTAGSQPRHVVSVLRRFFVRCDVVGVDKRYQIVHHSVQCLNSCLRGEGAVPGEVAGLLIELCGVVAVRPWLVGIVAAMLGPVAKLRADLTQRRGEETADETAQRPDYDSDIERELREMFGGVEETPISGAVRDQQNDALLTKVDALWTAFGEVVLEDGVTLHGLMQYSKQ